MSKKSKTTFITYNSWRIMRYYILFYILFVVTHVWGSTLSEDINQFSSNLFISSTISEEQHIAVLPFETTETHSDGDLGIAFAEFLISDIVQNNRSKVVDRTHVKKLMQEMILSETGMIDEAEKIELGKMASADFLVNGKIIKTMGAYVISAQIVNTSTSEIVGSARMTIPVASANRAISNLFEIHNYPIESGMRSLLLPGWGQSYADETRASILFASLCWAGLASSISTGILQQREYVQYESYSHLDGADFLKEQERIMDSLNVLAPVADSIYGVIQQDKYDTYKSKRKVFVISSSITGGLWLTNILNAFIMGKRAEQKYQLYFSANPTIESYAATITYNF